MTTTPLVEATYVLSIVADSGYESTTEGRCNVQQYSAAVRALHDAAWAHEITQARADLEAENKRLREVLEKLTHYAECQVAAFSNGRPFLDMTLFPRLCADARAALKGSNHD